MNVKNLIATVAVFAATGSAFAQGNSEFVEFTNFVSTKSRAEVQAELAQANAQGQIARNSDFVEFTNVASTKSRAEVRQEVLQAAKPTRTNIGG